MRNLQFMDEDKKVNMQALAGIHSTVIKVVGCGGGGSNAVTA